LDAAAEYLRRNCHTALSTDDASEVADLSPSHFRRLFQRQFGCSPREYLRRARVDRAKQLMLGSSQTLGDIARRCGFATVHSLSRAFSAVEGIAPSAYRSGGRDG
jgi:AraC family transcriptional regulator